MASFVRIPVQILHLHMPMQTPSADFLGLRDAPGFSLFKDEIGHLAWAETGNGLGAVDGRLSLCTPSLCRPGARGRDRWTHEHTFAGSGRGSRRLRRPRRCSPTGSSSATHRCTTTGQRQSRSSGWMLSFYCFARRWSGSQSAVDIFLVDVVLSSLSRGWSSPQSAPPAAPTAFTSAACTM